MSTTTRNLSPSPSLSPLFLCVSECREAGGRAAKGVTVCVPSCAFEGFLVCQCVEDICTYYFALRSNSVALFPFVGGAALFVWETSFGSPPFSEHPSVV